MKSTRIVKTLRGESGLIPFWFMRQAGRYLPEYKETRKQAGDFLTLCYTPELAVEVTLQPIKRFGMDAAIIFSDILVIPHALGMNVWFEEGHGPRLDPIKNETDVKKLTLENFNTKLSPIYEALKHTRTGLAEETSLIGFTGAPWTLLCYMLQGGGSKDYSQAIAFGKTEKSFQVLLNILVDAIVEHLSNQVAAGADIVQIFDSWAAAVPEDKFNDWVIEPTRKIITKFKIRNPDIPVIGFPRAVKQNQLLDFVKKTGVDAVGVDSSLPLEWIKNELQPLVCVQGNLDNQIFANNKEAAMKQTKEIINTLGGGRFIFNLGHGVLPHTPIENVQAVVDTIKAMRPA